jgi:hypothetical protein
MTCFLRVVSSEPGDDKSLLVQATMEVTDMTRLAEGLQGFMRKGTICEVHAVSPSLDMPSAVIAKINDDEFVVKKLLQ